MSPPTDPTPLRILSVPRPAPAPNPQQGKTLALTRVNSGQDIKIISIQLGPAKRDQLHEQGIVEARNAKVLHNDHKGRVILRIGSELFILGRLETARIFAVVV